MERGWVMVSEKAQTTMPCAQLLTQHLRASGKALHFSKSLENEKGETCS